MTVKELKEELNKFNDNLIVGGEIDNHFFIVSNVSQGVNEEDGLLILTEYEEEDEEEDD